MHFVHNHSTVFNVLVIRLLFTTRKLLLGKIILVNVTFEGFLKILANKSEELKNLIIDNVRLSCSEE